ncbi:hypothetical protein JF544_17450 [Halobacillus kuroshimensis]|uniref:Uncharacterized protein n=1 Tax=Halobacillus kuroshimensis TaxID=302481 RepID=A0ABS3E0E3_9BACI|nr:MULTISPECIES: hypothetical protein [Halobacillus]MBN8237046.1 hypothetical protein [Halobacillus kuroshimensis]
MYALVRKDSSVIEILRDPIDRRERIFTREEDAKEYADKLNVLIAHGPKWEIEKYL